MEMRREVADRLHRQPRNHRLRKSANLITAAKPSAGSETAALVNVISFANRIADR